VTAIVVSAVLSVTIARMAATADDPTQAAITALLEAPDSQVVTLSAPDGAATDAKIVLGASGVGYLFADSLPAISADRTYQLWVIVGEEVISAAVLGNDPAQSPFQVVGNVTGFAITDEVSGGVPVSEGSLVAVWSKSA